MDDRIQRFGFGIGRGWVVLFLIAGSLLLGAYWIGPLRPLPAQLELLAIDGDVAVERFAPAPRRTADGDVVFAVPLAARNVGAQPARPSRVVLSMPAQFRLATTRGWLPGAVSTGVPLRSYTIALPQPELRPGTQTEVLPGLDTIYIQPDLPRFYCTTQGLDIPEFSAAPEFDAQTLSDVRIFYSFTDAAGGGRQTGLLDLQLDPAFLDVSPAAAPPTFRTIIEEPEAQAPDTGPLSFVGARTAHCGDPELPVELYTVLWETAAGGRVFVVYVDNVGRKRLYDMNGDGIIELETWDGDGDGLFESRREARFAVPAFLMPLPPRDPAMTQPDPVPPDTAWLALFHSPERGPRRFAESSLSAHPQIAAADTLPADSVPAPASTPPTATPGTATPTDLGDERPATPEFLALFADTTAGPFRFTRRPAPPPPRVATPPTRPPADTQATAAPVEAEVDETPPPDPSPRPRRPPLGTPIPR